MSMGEHLIIPFPKLIDNRDMALHVGKASVRKDTRSNIAPVGRAKSQNRDSESGSIRGGSRDGEGGLYFKGSPLDANPHPRRQTRDFTVHKGNKNLMSRRYGVGIQAISHSEGAN